MALNLGILRFEEAYFERVWGGNKLRDVLGKQTPDDQVTGEDWLIADHASHESVVAAGPHAGRTLRSLLEEDPKAVLGSFPRQTRFNRFPLLLKLLDCELLLSVQVHPDDNAAEKFDEPDIGKAEMWYFLDAEPNAELVCGLKPGVDKRLFEEKLTEGDVGELVNRGKVVVDSTILLPAGTVHAIGGGVLIAEIQQNSDITYRIHDWNRKDRYGNYRELHVEKALRVTRFGAEHKGKTEPLSYDMDGCVCTVLGACSQFCGELLTTEDGFTRETRGKSFHLLLVRTGQLEVTSGGESCVLNPGEAAMVPGSAVAYEVKGTGSVFDYYIPELIPDIVVPLRAAGHEVNAIYQLGGDFRALDISE